MAVDPAFLDYRSELLENLSAQEVRDVYPDDLLLWAAGSGSPSPEAPGRFFCCLEYRERKKYLEGEAPRGVSANAAIIAGLNAAAERIRRPCRVCVIPVAQLGFQKAFRGKGPNGPELLRFPETLADNGCALTEVQFSGGAGEIKARISAADPTGGAANRLEREKSRAQNAVSDYKRQVYRECLSRVEGILVSCGVDEEILGRIRCLEP